MRNALTRETNKHITQSNCETKKSNNATQHQRTKKEEEEGPHNERHTNNKQAK